MRLFILIVCTFFVLNFGIAQSSNCENNVSANGSFETTSCSVGTTCNTDAFGEECVKPWFSAVGSPDLCKQWKIGDPNEVNPQDGEYFARMKTEFSPCGHEGIFIDKQFYDGQTYSYSLYARTFNDALLTDAVDLNVVTTNGLSNVGPQSGLGNCLSLPSETETVVLEEDFKTNAWQQFTGSFTPQTNANDQLAIYPTPPEGENSIIAWLFVDNVSITCASQLPPDFAWEQTGGLDINFTDLTPTNIPGLSVDEWHWDFGDGNTSTEQNPTHTYAGEGTYDVCLCITDNRGCTAEICIEITIVTIGTPCTCGTSPNIISGDVTYNTTQSFVNHVIIEPGASLTVDNTLIKMSPGCKILVKQGARLDLDNATLTTNCEQEKWLGIEVWGNSSMDHPSDISTITNGSYPSTNTEHGTVYALESNILSAEIGINDDNFPVPDPNNDGLNPVGFSQWGEHWGGIMVCDNTLFANCGRGAHLAQFPFTGFSPSINTFDNCTFNNVSSYGISIWDQDQVVIKNCTFDDITYAGVHGINYSATITDNDFNGPMIFGVESVNTPAHFLGGSLQVGTPTIENRFLSETRYGVRTSNVIGLEVINNDIDSRIVGVYTNEMSRFTIEGNDIAGAFVGQVNYRTEDNNNISECNTYSNHHFDGTRIIGDNKGYKFRLEEFTLPDNNDLNLIESGLIHVSQGQRDNPVLNLFSGLDNINHPNATISAPDFYYYHPGQNALNLYPELAPRCDYEGDNCVPSGPLNQFDAEGVDKNDDEYFDGCLELDGIGPGGTEPTTEPCYDEDCLEKINNQIDSVEQLLVLYPDSIDLIIALESLKLEKKNALITFTDSMHRAENYLELENVLDDQDEELAYQFRVAGYLAQKDFSNARNLITNMPTFEGGYKSNYQLVMNVWTDYLEQPDSFTLVDPDKTALINLAESEERFSGSAQALLSYLLGYYYEPYLGSTEESQNRTTSTQDLQEIHSESVVIRPNPASQQVVVDIKTPQDDRGKFDIKIFDLNGKLVKQSISSDRSSVLDVSQLNRGMFIIQIREKGEPVPIAVEKLVIQR